MATKLTAGIKPPEFKQVGFEIEGTAPLVMHKFSKKARDGMKDTAQKTSGARGRKKTAIDFDDALLEAVHISSDGWIGFPASAFRNGAISACRIIGFKMTLAKMGIFILEEGRDADEGVPLIRIYGEYSPLESVVRSQSTGGSTFVMRPIFDVWSARFMVSYDTSMFSSDDIFNLFIRVGMQVGIGEGRPDSKSSAGMGWGTFDVRPLSEQESFAYVANIQRNARLRMENAKSLPDRPEDSGETVRVLDESERG